RSRDGLPGRQAKRIAVELACPRSARAHPYGILGSELALESIVLERRREVDLGAAVVIDRKAARPERQLSLLVGVSDQSLKVEIQFTTDGHMDAQNRAEPLQGDSPRMQLALQLTWPVAAEAGQAWAVFFITTGGASHLEALDVQGRNGGVEASDSGLANQGAAARRNFDVGQLSGRKLVAAAR